MQSYKKLQIYFKKFPRSTHITNNSLNFFFPYSFLVAASIVLIKLDILIFILTFYHKHFIIKFPRWLHSLEIFSFKACTVVHQVVIPNFNWPIPIADISKNHFCSGRTNSPYPRHVPRLKLRWWLWCIHSLEKHPVSELLTCWDPGRRGTEPQSAVFRTQSSNSAVPGTG